MLCLHRLCLLTVVALMGFASNYHGLVLGERNARHKAQLNRNSDVSSGPAGASHSTVAPKIGLRPDSGDDSSAVRLVTLSQVDQTETESQQALLDDFESTEVGLFERRESQFGQWQREAGEVAIDPQHAKSGSSCLHLRGGEKTAVTVSLSKPASRHHMLRFWAERWTSRSPFSFRVEKAVDEEWIEIFNGDASVKVGRAFLNDVKIPLGEQPIKRLRFSCSSPAGTGILIDDMRIVEIKPQRIVAIKQEPFTLPALIGHDSAPLAKLRVTTEGSLDPLRLKSVIARLRASKDTAVIRWAFLSDQPGSKPPREMPLIGDPTGETLTLSREIQLHGDYLLSEGDNEFWINGFLGPENDLETRIGAELVTASFYNPKRTYAVTHAPSDAVSADAVSTSDQWLQRTGIALRDGGDDGVHTFRIPGLITTKLGTLIAVYDMRHRGGGDLPNDIDIGMSRSTDGGQHWEPMRVVMDMGRDPQWRYDGIGDPAVLVDQQTGTIWVAATWSHGNRSWVGSGPGMTPEQTGQVMMVRSDDDGVTWSKPINVTDQIKNPSWCFVLPGPGRGITMQDGTLVFAAQYQDPPNQRRLPHSTLLYSKDHGVTWKIGDGAWDDTTESQLVEIEPGVLMLNCRYNRKDRRVVMLTRDLGRTWEKHVTSERSLIEPRACMASLIRPYTLDHPSRRDWLLFSNPDSTRRRERLTIKASTDLGQTWLATNRLLLDEGVSAGYSCMSMIDDDHVGILYEGSQSHLTFQRIPIDHIITGATAEDLSVDDGERPFGDKKRGQYGTNAISGKDDSGPSKADEVVAAAQPISTLRLASIFADHMVMQADHPLSVWGEAKPESSVTVSLGAVTRVAQADPTGRWKVFLPPQSISKIGRSLRVSEGPETIEIKDVLIGEVWLCAGQSNMAWTLAQSTHGAEEISDVSKTGVRLLNLVGQAGGGAGAYSSEQVAALNPDRYYQGTWEKATPESAKSFSAVGWYFGKRLNQQLDTPIGLISMPVGGSPIEAWISEDALRSHQELQALLTRNWLDHPLLGDFCRMRAEQNLMELMARGEEIPFDPNGPLHPFKPGYLWKAGVDRVLPFAMRGVIWYQGESNAETPQRVVQYEPLFHLMVSDWRNRWKAHWLDAWKGLSSIESRKSDFVLPFYFAQLPAIERPDWPAFRESQRRLASGLDNVSMVVTLDTGHRTNVHPPLKKPVGGRLAEMALANTYHQPEFANASGPTVNLAKKKESGILITFDHCEGGLVCTENSEPRHFQIADQSGRFVQANAELQNGNQIWVWSESVQRPNAVRYAWVPYPNPSINVYNHSGYPASPFSINLDEFE